MDYSEYNLALVQPGAPSWDDEELAMLARHRVKPFNIEYLSGYLTDEKFDEKNYLLK